MFNKWSNTGPTMTQQMSKSDSKVYQQCSNSYAFKILMILILIILIQSPRQRNLSRNFISSIRILPATSPPQPTPFTYRTQRHSGFASPSA
eukprot:6693138-Heterocapsa_arctica.AAC.1